MKTLIISPTYNERKNIESLVEQIFKLDPSFHLLIIDDNSPDGTAKKVQELQNKLGKKIRLIDENIKEIHHRQPVIINENDVNRYLNLELTGSSFLKECKKTKLNFHEVSKEVNKPTNNNISLIQTIS